jgi:hypothetical protein
LAGRTFPISGQIEPRSFPFLVADLHRNGATGSLKVEGPTYQKALYFRHGRVLFGSSNDPRDQLGAILIEEGRITPEQLEDVNSKVGPGNPLAKVLAETGFVSQRELSDAARAKVERIFSDVVGYTSGTFEFEDGVLPKGAVDLKLSTERLILTAVRRITDRTFVLRHLDGLDVVLRPAADLAALRTEIEPDTGGLLGQLDGLSTLKEAAGRTRLDDFEAAKVACALLFLGAVERVGPGGVEGPELDLAETAREAFGEEWTAPEAAPPPPPPPRRRVGDDTIIAWGKIDPQAFSPERGGAAAPASAPAAPSARTLLPDPVSAAPAVLVEPEPEIVVAPVAPAPPEPPATPPATPQPPAVATPPAAPPLIAVPPPEEPPRVTPSRPVPREPEPPLPAPSPSAASAPPRTWSPPSPTPAARTPRPSQADMAAVDALLNPRKVEGPLAPLERMPEARWTPPARSVRARRSAGPAWQRGALLAGFVAIAAVGFAAVWYFLSRPPRGAASRPSPPPVAAMPTAQPPATVAVGPSVAAPDAPPLASTAPAPVPTTRPALAGGGLAASRDLLRNGRFAAAAEGFANHLRGTSASTASVQLFVACSPDTVGKAVAAVNTGEMLIVPVRFQGRDCFRMCWGVYPSAAAAASAARSLPDYFVQGGASPRVMTRDELVP